MAYNEGLRLQQRYASQDQERKNSIHSPKRQNRGGRESAEMATSPERPGSVISAKSKNSNKRSKAKPEIRNSYEMLTMSQFKNGRLTQSPRRIRLTQSLQVGGAEIVKNGGTGAGTAAGTGTGLSMTLNSTLALQNQASLLKAKRGIEDE